MTHDLNKNTLKNNKNKSCRIVSHLLFFFPNKISIINIYLKLIINVEFKMKINAQIKEIKFYFVLLINYDTRNFPHCSQTYPT